MIICHFYFVHERGKKHVCTLSSKHPAAYCMQLPLPLVNLVGESDVCREMALGSVWSGVALLLWVTGWLATKKRAGYFVVRLTEPP